MRALASYLLVVFRFHLQACVSSSCVLLGVRALPGLQAYICLCPQLSLYIHASLIRMIV